MAVYNAGQFLRPQLESILAQLRPGDEVIAVDDCSTDGSERVLKHLCNGPLRVYRNDSNAGVMRTFQRAIELSGQEIIFLSDQDDLWLPGKLSKSLAVFKADHSVTMVASDATLIDENGQTLVRSFYARRGSFKPGILHNLAKNKYLGCTLSFRRRMLDYFLPIPTDVPMHDMWFGILNQIFGKTYFIDEPLVAYRRHNRNATAETHSGMLRMVTWRWRLAKNVLSRATVGLSKPAQPV